MTRAAGIDCGTNTIRLLVADLDPVTGAEEELVREMRVVRLGQDVDRTGLLADEALERVFAAVEEYARIIDRHEAEAVRFCATSAARDAENAAAFLGGVRERLGVEAEVVTGDQEAALTYDGATRSLGPEVAAPLLVVDIGGGSTELILGNGHGQVLAAQSLDIGSVRMTERRMPSDPPTPAEVAAATADVDAALDGCTVPLDRAATVVGVAGTVTTVAAMVLDLPGYQRERVHHAVLPIEDIDRGTADLLTMTVAQRRALPFMHPGRADVIGGGALILDRLLRRTGARSLLVSETDILDGIAWSVA
ncbi:MAG TPA: exopolyphosphatase [Nocardioidaceae bacterium]|nr:exopolyphosphatase [Nocardioidaceae bacterium]